MDITNRTSLIQHINRGKRVKYLFFWGHKEKKRGLSKSCLSQWYPAPFKINGVIYPTAEHFMMAEKAQLFGDTIAFEKILASLSPEQAKRFGRQVKGFKDDLWKDHSFDIVVRGNLAKFSQNRALKDFLMGTGKKVLVEASPVDAIWGVKMAEDDPSITNPLMWRGLNLLGFALMAVRSQIILGSDQGMRMK